MGKFFKENTPVQINKVSETNLAGKCQEQQEDFYLKNHEIQSPENKAAVCNIHEKILLHSLPQKR